MTVFRRAQNPPQNVANPAQRDAVAALCAAARDDAHTESSSDGAETDSNEEEEQQEAPVAAAGPQPAAAFRPLYIDGVQWQAMPEGIPQDFREQTGVGNRQPHIRWNKAQIRVDPALDKTIFHYFLAMFPDMIESICLWTTPGLKKPLTPYDLVKFFGICTAMTLQPMRSRDEYWREQDS